MNLRELFDQLDWSAVDAQHAAWAATHDTPVHISAEDLREQRLQRVYTALTGLQIVGDAERKDPRLWATLPEPIRRQIVDILKRKGLYAPEAESRSED